LGINDHFSPCRESEPTIGIAVICGFFMVVFTIWVGIGVFASLKLMWSESKAHLSTLLIIFNFTFLFYLNF
jgi:hypothetical protein